MAGVDEIKADANWAPKDDTPTTLRVTVPVPGLKANGDNIVIRFESQSIHFVAELKVNDRTKRYTLPRTKLPGQIKRKESNYEVWEGKVILNLKKAKEEYWTAVLEDRGLFEKEDSL